MSSMVEGGGIEEMSWGAGCAEDAREERSADAVGEIKEYAKTVAE
jgi:hypothetical protein